MLAAIAAASVGAKSHVFAEELWKYRGNWWDKDLRDTGTGGSSQRSPRRIAA